MTALRFAAEELDNEKQAEDEYDEFLRQQAQQLKLNDYQPKVFFTVDFEIFVLYFYFCLSEVILHT